VSVYGLTWAAYIISDAVYMAVLYRYFSSAFDMRYRPRTTVVAYLLCFIAGAHLVWLDSVAINIATSAIVFGLLVHLYKGNRRSRIIHAIFIYAAAYMSDFAVALATVHITKIPTEAISIGTPEFLYGTLASKILFMVFAKLLPDITKQRRLPRLSTIHWAALIAVPTGSLFVLYNFLYLRAHSLADIISSVIIAGVNFVAIVAYDKILADYETAAKAKLLEEQVKYYAYQNFLAEGSAEALKKMRHDIKHMLVGFQADIQRHNIAQLEARIADLLGSVDSMGGGPARTGNLPIDAIVNFKLDEARKKQVQCSLKLVVPENLDLDSTVVCQILGNALDNAIEAASRVGSPGERLVRLFMSYKQESLYIKVVNPFVGGIARDSRGGFLSSKRGFRSTGLGLQSIENAVAGGRGSVEADHEGGEFCLNIVLYGVHLLAPAPAAR